MLSTRLFSSSSGYIAFKQSQQPIPPSSTGGSALFNGTSQYLTVSNSSDFNVGTGNVTIEWFQYMTTSSSYPRIFSIGAYPSAVIGVSIEGGTMYVWIAGGARISVSISGYTNVWIHFAIVRNGTSLVLYRNGTSIGTATNSSNITSALNLLIGSEGGANTYYGGNITNFRWTNSAVYTSNFTTPSSPLSSLPQTKLLLLFSTLAGLLTDSSGTGKTVSNTTGVEWSSSTPFVS